MGLLDPISQAGSSFEKGADNAGRSIQEAARSAANAAQYIERGLKIFGVCILCAALITSCTSEKSVLFMANAVLWTASTVPILTLSLPGGHICVIEILALFLVTIINDNRTFAITVFLAMQMLAVVLAFAWIENDDDRTTKMTEIGWAALGIVAVGLTFFLAWTIRKIDVFAMCSWTEGWLICLAALLLFGGNGSPFAVLRQSRPTADPASAPASVRPSAPAFPVFRGPSAADLWPMQKFLARCGRFQQAGASGSGASSPPDPRSSGLRPCVLLTTEALNPPHRGHVEMMERARRELESRGFSVLGGWISASHQSYVEKKAKASGVECFAARLRVKLVRTMVEQSDWLAAAAWEAMGQGQNDAWPDFPDVCAALRHHLANSISMDGLQDLMLFYVCGQDHFEKCSLRNGLGSGLGVVAVPRCGRQVVLRPGVPNVVACSDASANEESRITQSFSSMELQRVLSRPLVDGGAVTTVKHMMGEPAAGLLVSIKAVESF